MTTKKTPTAAELARREAQSKNDRGEVAPIHVEVRGIALDFNPADLLDDYDAMTALMEQGVPTRCWPCLSPMRVSVRPPWMCCVMRTASYV